MKPIAIQGGRASFHDMAAHQVFRERELPLLECATFRELCKALVEERADAAVMAIENTLVGSILPNYALMEEYGLHIVGETYLHIQQNLLALPGQSLGDLHSVRSHPMALLQCSDFLEAHPHLNPIESADTADSAREIREKRLDGVAAIASARAAEIYGLAVIEREIENLKHNYTRFLVLARAPQPPTPDIDKASVSFVLAHEVGTLAGILNIFQQFSLNLTLIQSVPIPTQPHEYRFHVDLEWSRREPFDAAMREVAALSHHLRILGMYPRGVKPHDHIARQTA